MPLFDRAIFDPRIFDTGTDEAVLSNIIVLVEKRKRNTLWQPYVWRHGMWEKTILRENVKKMERQK